MAFDASSFTAESKPLPIILLLDVSGSMSSKMNNGATTRIEVLNSTVRTMISELKQTIAKDVTIKFCALAYNNEVKVHIPMQNIETVEWKDLKTCGGTELKYALAKAKSLIEDKSVIPSRSYRPAVILVSDGVPFPGWETPMNDFISFGRSAKCDRMAMLIDDSEVANSGKESMFVFLKDSGNKLFWAKDAAGIVNFFKLVTMTTTTRTLSKNPNVTQKMPEFAKENTLEETVLETKVAVEPSIDATIDATVVMGGEEEDDE